MAEAPQVLEVFEMAVKEVSQALAVEQQIMMWPVLKLIPLQRLPLKMIEIQMPHPFAQKPEPDPEP